MHSLVKAMAVDLARHGITVNMIAPGPILTPNNKVAFEAEEARHSFRRDVPLGEPGHPEIIAAAALYLAAKDSHFVTGTSLVVDGGTLAQILPSEPKEYPA